jgi:hypothetical protein
MATIYCSVCKKEFKVKPSHVDRRKNCSRKCANKTLEAVAWAKYLGSHFRDKNPGTLGYKYTSEQKERVRKTHLGYTQSSETVAKRRETLIQNSTKRKDWKGDDVGYRGLHERIKTRLGKPNKCSHCGTTAKSMYHWANVSGEYKMDLKDWIRLCVSCHKKFDYGRKQGRYKFL